MHRPRRTTEYETPSAATRQSRPSRLQQPLRRPSFRRDGSLPRASSVEPISTLAAASGNHLALPSSTKRSRSSSVSNVRTPQRTPTHITPSKVSQTQFTGEKQRPPVNDKRWIQEQVVKITEYLKTVECGINTDFLYKGGLKTMSIKQFIGLVNYFLKFVVGNKFTVGANHVESISKILNQIDYPYTVNKSWLKTPTAPHAFGNAVMLFAFFMEFIPPGDNLESFKESYLIVSEEFPDKEFAFKLPNMAEEGFALWNNQKDEEFEKLQKAAVEELIYKKLSIAGDGAFENEIKRLNAELDRIDIKRAVVSDEAEFFRLDKEVKTNQRSIAKLKKTRHENQKTIKQLESQLNVQLEQIEKVTLRIDEIRKVVAAQEVSVEKRNKLIEDLSQMQYILKTKEQSVNDLQEMDHQNQVLLSRTIKQLTEKIAKFNSYIRETMLQFKDVDVDVEALCLHQDPEAELQDQLNEISVFLKRLQKHISNRVEELSQSNEKFEAQIKLVSYEIAEWIEPKNKKVMENLKEQQKKVYDLDREMIAVKNDTTSRVSEFAEKIKQANERIDALKKAIKETSEAIVKTSKENEDILEVVKQRFGEALAIKESRLKRFGEILQTIENQCDLVKSLMKKKD